MNPPKANTGTSRSRLLPAGIDRLGQKLLPFASVPPDGMPHALTVTAAAEVLVNLIRPRMKRLVEAPWLLVNNVAGLVVSTVGRNIWVGMTVIAGTGN